jgi:cytochrome b involved in lipid metabolism
MQNSHKWLILAAAILLLGIIGVLTFQYFGNVATNSTTKNIQLTSNSSTKIGPAGKNSVNQGGVKMIKTNSSVTESQSSEPSTESTKTSQALESSLESTISTLPQTSANPTPPTESKEFKTISIEALSTHNSSTDCWASISGKVYNLTEYAPNHPGGAKKIYKYCGKSMDSIKNHPGGDFLGTVIQAIISQYYVGDI